MLEGGVIVNVIVCMAMFVMLMVFVVAILVLFLALLLLWQFVMRSWCCLMTRAIKRQLVLWGLDQKSRALLWSLWADERVLERARKYFDPLNDPNVMETCAAGWRAYDKLEACRHAHIEEWRIRAFRRDCSN